MTIAYTQTFLGGTKRYASQYSEQQSLRNRLLEVQDDKNLRDNEVEDNALSSHHGENSPSRSQVSSPSMRRTHSCPKGPESVRSRIPEGTLALTHDPFTTISNLRKCKAHSEVFEAFTRRPRGNDPNHISLGDASMTMAKSVLH